MLQQLIDEALGLGIGFKWADLGRRHGEYRHRQNLILINRRLSGPTSLCALAHELGHAWYCDDAAAGEMTPDQEYRATTWAAQRLISPIEYALAERTVGAHPGAIARELGVPLSLIETWQTHRGISRLAQRVA